MKITQITCYEVIVPGHKEAIQSKGINKPLHKLPVGAQAGWKFQFDDIPKLVLKLELETGIVGWGELYRGHNWDIVEDICKLLLGKSLKDMSLQNLPFTYTRAYDGFECALWDAYAKSHGLRVVDLLGGPVREKVKVGAWSGHRAVGDLAELAIKYTEQGYDCLKFKSDLDDDVVRWSEEIFEASPKMKIILDPNERWENTFEAKKRIDGLRKTGNVLCLEDPIPRWKLSEYKSLRNYSSIPIVMHVSLPYILHGQRIEDSIKAIQAEAVDGFNFNCGLADFQRLDHIATVSQLPTWHGSEIDLGILEAMYIHSAAAAKSCVWPSDIFGRLIREHDLLKTPLRIEPPYAYLPEGPGLGIEPDMDVLERYKVKQKVFRK